MRESCHLLPVWRNVLSNTRYPLLLHSLEPHPFLLVPGVTRQARLSIVLFWGHTFFYSSQVLHMYTYTQVLPTGHDCLSSIVLFWATPFFYSSQVLPHRALLSPFSWESWRTRRPPGQPWTSHVYPLYRTTQIILPSLWRQVVFNFSMIVVQLRVQLTYDEIQKNCASWNVKFFYLSCGVWAKFRIRMLVLKETTKYQSWLLFFILINWCANKYCIWNIFYLLRKCCIIKIVNNDFIWTFV